jgi:hypothetical protein
VLIIRFCTSGYLVSHCSFFHLFLSSAGNRHGGGKISASGGDGLAGGGGGRVSINVFSRHDDTQIFVHGNFL